MPLWIRQQVQALLWQDCLIECMSDKTGPRPGFCLPAFWLRCGFLVRLWCMALGCGFSVAGRVRRCAKLRPRAEASFVTGAEALLRPHPACRYTVPLVEGVARLCRAAVAVPPCRLPNPVILVCGMTVGVTSNHLRHSRAECGMYGQNSLLICHSARSEAESQNPCRLRLLPAFSQCRMIGCFHTAFRSSSWQ